MSLPTYKSQSIKPTSVVGTFITKTSEFTPEFDWQSDVFDSITLPQRYHVNALVSFLMENDFKFSHQDQVIDAREVAESVDPSFKFKSPKPTIASPPKDKLTKASLEARVSELETLVQKLQVTVEALSQ